MDVAPWARAQATTLASCTCSPVQRQPAPSAARSSQRRHREALRSRGSHRRCRAPRSESCRGRWPPAAWSCARYSRMICGVTARYRSSVVRNATACPRWSRLRSVAASSTLVSTTTRGGGSALIVTVELGAIKRCSAPRGDRPKAQQAGRCFGDRLGGDPREGVAKLLLRGVPPSRRAPPEGRDRLVRHIPDVKCLHHPMLAQALASGCPRIEQPPKWEHTSTGEAT